MKRGIALILTLAPMCAAAGWESMVNPMMLTNPLANPYAMAAPLGGALLLPGLVGGPLGGLGGPLGMVAPAAGMGVMQVAPSWLSFQHRAPGMLTNPYLGGAFSQLPFTQAGRAASFAPGANGLSPFTRTMPTYGGVYPGIWSGGASAAPALPLNPYLVPASPAVSPAPINSLDWFKQGAPTPQSAPAAQVEPIGVPFVSPWASSAPTAVPPLAMPAGSATDSGLAPSQESGTALTPFDPAYWLMPLKSSVPPTQ